MPRAKNDPYKRRSAQALNHLAGAILDMNDVYIPFESQMKMLQEQVAEIDQLLESANAAGYPTQGQPQVEQDRARLQANAERYEQYVKDLYSIMMGIAAVREHIILFIGEVWNLDEESVKVYIG